MSTQNFNTTASAGALLGGAMIGSERAMADGRNGVEQWLMRQWAWKNGSGQEHLDHYYKRHAEAKLAVGFDAATSTASATWTVGGSAIEAASRTLIRADDAKPGELKKTGAANLVRRLVDGTDPTPPQTITRDTPYVQEGYGRLEKNGAVLAAEANRRLCLLTEPKAGVTCGWNPLPDLTAGWTLTAPGGQTVTADGRVGICRVTLQGGRVDIEHAFKPGQEREEGAATAFLVSGAKAEPAFTLNGAKVTPVAASDGWRISLGKP